MIELKEDQDVYLTHFADREQRAAAEPAWLGGLRKGAMDRFASLGFPTTHNEDWKYTNVAAIAKLAVRPAPEAKLTRKDLDRLPLANLGCGVRLVFLNGRFSPELSAVDGMPAGVRAASLAAVLKNGSAALENHIARYAGFEENAFVALNTALFEDGALIEIAKGTVVEEPIHLVFLTAAGGDPWVAHPRNLILAGRGSQAAVIETYVTAGEGVHFTNAVTEIVAAEGAVTEHYKLQDEGAQAFHVGTIQVLQERSSALTSHNVGFGAALARNDVNGVLDGEGAECMLNGLYVTTGKQHVDNHSTLDHAKPNCNSRELYKGILDGQGTGVFNGKIIVHKDAQKTNALQSNKNLLLSADSAVNTKPQLEIFADDVRCTHGATVGQLDKDALFYMQTRGIPREAARDLLTYAFAGELFDRMKWAPARERLEQELYRKLSRGRKL
jgi:Fe-S cluster assembly protein SufD